MMSQTKLLSIKADRATLANELQFCANVVERRHTIPILSCVLIRAESDHLSIAATDIELTVQTSCAATIVSEGSAVVDLQMLLALVKAAPDDEVELAVTDNGRVAVTSGSARYAIPIEPIAEYPVLPSFEETAAFEGSSLPVVVPLSDVKSVISGVVHAVSVDEQQFNLVGPIVRFEPNYAEAWASDGHRIAVATINTTRTTTDGVLIQLKLAKIIAKIEWVGGDVSFASSRDHVRFIVGYRTLMCRRVDCSIPEYRTLLPKDLARFAIVAREQLLSAIGRALLVSPSSACVAITFDKGKLTVATSRSERGAGSETISADYSGAAVTFGISGDYLADSLRSVESKQVRLSLNDNAKRIVVEPEGDTSETTYLFVIASMRLSEEK